MNDKVQIKLWQVSERVKRLRIRWAMALLAALILLTGLVLYAIGRESLIWQRNFLIGLLLFSAFWVLVSRILIRRFGPSSQHLAKLVEDRFPELRQSLVTAVDPQARLWGNPLLTRETREKSLDHSHRNSWAKVIPLRQRLALAFVNLVLLVGFGTLAFLITTRPASGRLSSVSQGIQKVPDGLKIDPGTIEIERGSSVTISATFGNVSPLDVQLVTSLPSDKPQPTKPAETAPNDTEAPHSSDTPVTEPKQDTPPVQIQSVAMRKSLQDPVFSQLISDIRQNTDYAVAYDGLRSETYRITVFDYPELVRSDATLTYPQYTGLAESKVENTKRVRMVEGTTLKWQLYLNKPVVSCQLIDDDGVIVESQASPDDAQLRIVQMSPTKTGKWKVVLKDEAARGSKLEYFLNITVTPNLPPVIKLTAGADRSVSPIEEWAAAADITDDFGVVKSGIGYTYRDQDFDVAVQEANSKKASAQNRFDMESLKAIPDDLLTYWFWAEDYDVQGVIRRTSSDLYFAEIRPFEEIFRQSQASQNQQQQQQQQQQGGAGQQTEELLQLQKQIISATWNIQRRDNDLDEFRKADIDTLKDSQTSALDKLQELLGEIQDATAKQAAQGAATSMQRAIELLAAVQADNWSKQLSQALTSEQQAYQGLLKLRAREHEITQSQRQNQRQSGGAGQQQRQQQIDQLKLEENENRYETQSQASEQQPQANQAQQEIQNRLKDLAERQSDLNEQIRQLESALQQAQTEKEKRDAQEQLKRLREAQEELLRDTDELLEQMQQEQQQSQALEQAAEQTQQSRESLQQATQNLREGRTSEALSAGTRAQQSLDQTQEDLRKNSAEGLSESLRNLKSQANEMVERQQQVRENMQNRQTNAETPGLRSDVSKEQLQQDILQQREDLKNLQQDLQDTVLQAESTEPLVADALYNTYQQTQKENLAEQLEGQSILMDRAMPEEALKLAGSSLEQMQQLQQQIDAAAGDVLGSDLADLERAASNLERLRDQIDREFGDDPNRQRNQRNGNQQSNEATDQDQQQGDAQDSQRSGDQQQGNDDQQSPENQNASNQNGDRQNENSQDGERQNAQRNGQNQNGEPQSDQTQDDQQAQTRGEGQTDQQQQERQGNQGQAQGQPQQQQSSEQQPPNGQGGQGNQAGQPNQSGQAQESDNQSDTQQGSPQNQAGRNRGSQNNNDGRGGGGGLLDQINQLATEQQSAVQRPLTGEAFRQFNDALRDVGQLLEGRDDRALAEGIRQAARQMRSEYRRHSQPPNRELVDKLIVTPLDELIDRVGLELQRKRAGNTAIVPLDNDPVPAGYDRAVQVYYENLGKGDRAPATNPR